MRIAFFVDNAFTCPPAPDAIAASSEIVCNLADGLVKKGHDVTLFAPEGSTGAAKIETSGLQPYLSVREPADYYRWKDVVMNSYKLIAISDMYSKSDRFDIIHHHTEPNWLAFPLSKYSSAVSLFTIHNVIDDNLNFMVDQYHLPANNGFISLSFNQRKMATNYNFVANIYNGIDLSQFEFNDRPDDHFVFIGRLVPDKGAHTAIQIALKAQIKLEIAGPRGTTEQEVSYWDQYIGPYVDDDQIKYVGLVKRERRSDFLKQAKGMIFPLQWDEPFGLVVPESMACGTPVIAYKRGAIPELIDDGRTGYLIEPDEQEQMVEAVKKVSQIDRRKCREHVEEHFSLERMIDEYELLYQRLLTR